VTKRVVYHELVKENMERNRRAQEWENKVQQAKRDQAEARIRRLAESKKQMQQERIKALKKSWEEKTKLMNVIDTIKMTNNPKALHGLAKKMGVEVPRKMHLSKSDPGLGVAD